jgi:phospholipid/cholesterol/gamma-HCH transport system ATP-binding protein
MVTHDLDTLFELSTRVAVVADKRILVSGAPREVMSNPHPFIHDFFLGERGQRINLTRSPLVPLCWPCWLC